MRTQPIPVALALDPISWQMREERPQRHSQLSGRQGTLLLTSTQDCSQTHSFNLLQRMAEEELTNLHRFGTCYSLDTVFAGQRLLPFVRGIQRQIRETIVRVDYDLVEQQVVSLHHEVDCFRLEKICTVIPPHFDAFVSVTRKYS